MDQTVAAIALDAMPVLALALSVVLLPFALEPPTTPSRRNRRRW